jgi:predicted nucleotidyltransferase
MPRQTVPRHAYSKAEVAQALGVSVDYIEEHVWSDLRKVRRGRRSFVPVVELDNWLKREASLDG